MNAGKGGIIGVSPHFRRFLLPCIRKKLWAAALWMCLQAFRLPHGWLRERVELPYEVGSYVQI